jgi:hypothetical protein
MRTRRPLTVSCRTNVTVDCGRRRAFALDKPGGVPPPTPGFRVAVGKSPQMPRRSADRADITVTRPARSIREKSGAQAANSMVARVSPCFATRLAGRPRAQMRSTSMPSQPSGITTASSAQSAGSLLVRRIPVSP